MTNKSKKQIFIMILIIQIMQSVFVIYSTITYKGVHDVVSLILLPIALIYGSHKILYKNDNISHNNIRLALILILILIIPLTLFLSQPEYTYEEGKDLIIEKNNQYTKSDFTKLKFSRSTIRTRYEPEIFFIRHKGYYYKVYNADKYMYYFVVPVDGKVFEIDKWKWADDN